MSSCPPLGMASRELTARFISTCSNMPRSALMEGRPGAKSTRKAMSSPKMRRSILPTLLTTSFKSATCKCSSCLRLKVINWRVRSLARLVAAADFFERVGRLGAGGRPGHEHAHVAADDGEEIVEIVGDAAGQLADRFHFLGLAQLGLQPAALGHVHNHGKPGLPRPDGQPVAVGAQGVISVASNVIPRQVSLMVKAYATGDTRAALKLHQQAVLPAVQRPVHRDQPRAGESRAGHAGPNRRGIPPPAGADERQEPRDLQATMKAVGVLK